ncbi:MAG: hypothetical protein A4E66_00052 [Syntrophus sp. PtaB.Bin001]|nr:MAG: hypothetical protein A4E66_00052 [Syntrophus sp. PtaB.Bin001]
MAMVLPREVQLKVREAVYRKADEFGYMHKGRIENGIFMENLVKDREVGGMLAQYILKNAIKTYIKDGILNRYMKDKKKTILSSKSHDLLLIIQKIYQQEAYPIEQKNQVFLFRLENNDILLISQGTLLKWETALRKALEFVEKSPGLPPEEGVLHIVLNIACLGQPSTEADRDHLKKTLAYVGVDIHFADLL